MTHEEELKELKYREFKQVGVETDYKEPKQAFINGCNTKNGTRPLNALEIKASTTLSNGMYAVAGYIPLDGISVDVYKNKTMKDLIFMEHGMISNDETDYNMAFTLAEIRCNEMGI